MTTPAAKAKEVARQAAEGSATDSFLQRLAEGVGARVNVRAVFGEPIERGDVTVVPVARVRWGFGGGSGQGSSEQGSGSGAGGGGGGTADPVGYLLIGPGGATFERIHQRLSAPLILAAGFSAALLVRALARLLHR